VVIADTRQQVDEAVLRIAISCPNPHGSSDSSCPLRGVNSTTNSHSFKTGGEADWAGTAHDTFC
jgi:hypothetical protein